MPFKNLIAFIAFSFFNCIAASSFSQVVSISLGLDGLTCPLCSRGVENSLKKLTFIEEITMDLENTSATITFKPNSTVSYAEVIKKVFDAGFSTRFLIVRVNMAFMNQSSNKCLNYGGISYQIINSENSAFTGFINLQVIDKDYMQVREFSKYAKTISESGTGCEDKNFREVYNVIIL
ncbi:MAG: heavy-metal-associated domain-containing protein [Bacteroidetes bacterium]|nr:heavy-metal-associated domain-containing protein [Bacteroidota bacterium]